MLVKLGICLDRVKDPDFDMGCFILSNAELYETVGKESLPFCVTSLQLYLDESFSRYSGVYTSYDMLVIYTCVEQIFSSYVGEIF